MEPWNSVAGTFGLHTNVIMTEAVPVFGKGRCEPPQPTERLADDPVGEHM
jgi:hypothetical protein